VHKIIILFSLSAPSGGCIKIIIMLLYYVG